MYPPLAEMRRQRSAGATSRWASKATKFRCGSRLASTRALSRHWTWRLRRLRDGHQAERATEFQPGPDAVLPDASVIGLRAAFVGTMVSTFPTISHGLRTSLHALCLPHREATAAIRWSEAAVLVLLVGLVSNAVDNLGLVFQLVGSTCGSVLMFILPLRSSCLARGKRARPSLLLMRASSGAWVRPSWHGWPYCSASPSSSVATS